MNESISIWNNEGQPSLRSDDRQQAAQHSQGTPMTPGSEYPGHAQSGSWATPAGYPPPMSGYGVDVYGRPLSDKSKITAGLLEILLGSFGAGRFYLGYTGIGIAQIAAVWLTCGFASIWTLIDGIMMLTGKVPDARGLTLRD